MLADLLLNYESSAIGRQLPRELASPYAIVGKQVADAPRYVLNREAVMLVQSVTTMSPPRFLAALQICRMPFPTMWIEFAYKDREDWLRQTHQSVAENANAYPPSRLGFYLQQLDCYPGDEGKLAQATLVWVHRLDKIGHRSTCEEEGVNICGLSLTIDMRPDTFIDPATREVVRRDLHQAVADRLESFARGFDWKEEEAYVKMESRIETAYCPFMEPMWRYLEQHSPDTASRLVDAAIFDLRAEWKFILALLMVLNSRNMISYGDPVDLRNLNRARAKRRQRPLLNYSEIKLSQSRVQQRRMGLGGRHAPTLAHYVNGHWKIRKTGLFWWSPHVRGKEGTAIHKTIGVRG